MSYFMCLEAKNVDKYLTFAWFSGWKAPGIKTSSISRVWKGPGGPSCCTLRVWKVPGGNISSILPVWTALGGSMCRILRVWKLNMSINSSHLLGFGMEGSGRQNQSYFTCLEGSGRLNVSYCTRLEAQSVDKYFTCARFWEAQGGSVTLGPVENIGNLGPLGT